MMQLPRPDQPLVCHLFRYAPAALLLLPLAGFAQTATRTALTVAGDGAKVELTAHVADTVGTPVTAGTVTFQAGAQQVGAASLGADGSATLTLGALPDAPQGVVAVFHPLLDGTTGLAASASQPAAVHSNADGVPTFTLTASSLTLSTAQGGFATTTLTVTPVNGYVAQVTLSCENLPAYATCNFSPVIDSTANGAFTSTLQIQTQGPGGVTQLRPSSTTQLAYGALLPASLLLLAGTRRRRRGTVVWLALGFSAVGMVGLAGCGARYGYQHHPPVEPGGTPTGLANITVLASGNTGSAVITQPITVALTVQ